MTKRILAVSSSVIILALINAVPASAAFIGFNTLAGWQAAVGTVNGSEDFNSFAVDAQFRTTSVALNNMVVTGTTGINGTVTQKVDASPFEFSGFYDFDGTSYLLGDVTGTEYVRIDFLSPVNAWGAWTVGLADGGPTTRDTEIQVYDASNVLLGTIFPSSDLSGAQVIFYGFQLTGGEQAAYLLFTDNDVIPTNDVFGLDDIQFNAAVPEPATLLLLGTGLAAAGMRRRMKKRA